MMTLKMLSAATGNKYEPKEIMGKVDFVMTASTSHNITVVKQVCENLNCEKIPSSLVCDYHPLMMFQRKVKELYQTITIVLVIITLKTAFL